MNDGDNQIDYFAVVLAGGSGSRFKTKEGTVPKQYRQLAGKTVLEHSVQTVCAATFPKRCIITHPKHDAFIGRLHFSWPVTLVQGGQERMDSVLHALHALKPDAQAHDFVLVHDGARPCVKKQDILKLIEQTKNHEIGGLLAAPVTDTIKQVKHSSNQSVVQATLDRQALWAAQTPQLFRFGLLLAALTQAKESKLHVTDDASALELMGYQPLIVSGSQTNIKITHPHDLPIAALLMAQDKGDHL